MLVFGFVCTGFGAVVQQYNPKYLIDFSQTEHEKNDYGLHRRGWRDPEQLIQKETCVEQANVTTFILIHYCSLGCRAVSVDQYFINTDSQPLTSF